VDANWSFIFTFGLFVFHMQCPAMAESEKKRHRFIFKMLTSSKNNRKVNETDVNNGLIGDGINARVGHIRRNNTMTIVSDNRREPPLISGRKSNLTLTMVGKFKKTWCKTEPFLQLIKEPGCISRKVLNRFCYGQCNSFYIPKTLRKRTKRKFFKSCGFCEPKKTHTIIVTLKCPGKTKGYKHKKIKQIKHCRCMERWKGTV
jgi:hypothetical protein